MNDAKALYKLLWEIDHGRRMKDAGTGHPVATATRVYRIEMPNGHGPYNSGLPNAEEIYQVICQPREGYNCARLAKANGEQMGLTEEAFNDAHGGTATYACDSLASLHDWFPDKARAYLATYGAKTVEYEVPAGGHIATVGHGEVIFARSEARKVRELPLIEQERKAA